MKKSNKSAKRFTHWAVVLTLASSLLIIGLFTACPNAAKGGGKSGPAYVKAPYDKLETYLANTASADKVNYIEITGEVPKEWFTGKAVSGNNEAGELGKKILAAAPKKVALKLPGEVAGLDSMSLCFAGCSNLVSLAGIPATVTNMANCFYGCESLIKAPVISAKVTDMSWCFYGCTSLAQAPAIPANVTDMNGCFSGCTSLAQAPAIPANVTDMSWCFYDCTSLTQCPVIPAKVTNMESCFSDCKSLTQAPDIPASVTNMPACFSGCSALKGVKLLCNYDGTGHEFTNVFLDCAALEKGGIKVKNEHYDAYTDQAALDNMAVPPIGNDTEQKKKFSTF